MRKIIFFILGISVFFCGCGYTTHSALPSNRRSVYVEDFVNKVRITAETSNRRSYYPYKPGMETEITRAIIDRFIFDGIYQIKDSQNACFILKGQLVDYMAQPLEYDSNDNVTQYRLRVIVNIQLYQNETAELVWQEKRFAGEAAYRKEGAYSETEDTAMDEAIEDLARRVVERTVENW